MLLNKIIWNKYDKLNRFDITTKYDFVVGAFGVNTKIKNILKTGYTPPKTVKFLNNTFDASNITIDFLYTADTYCASTLQIARFCGINFKTEEIKTDSNVLRLRGKDENK